MNVASYISPPPETDGVIPSGIGTSGVWEFLWLFSAWVLSALGQGDVMPMNALYPNGRDCCDTPRRRYRPARHQRRMIARRARGIRPVIRYDCAGFAAFLPNANQKPLTRTQYLERSLKLLPMGRFQLYNWLYCVRYFRKVVTYRALNRLGDFTVQCLCKCEAPLKPD